MTDKQSIRLSSSLRSRSVEESLGIAESLAMGRGISRVVDTTWLDRIGIPVYSSIRPDAVKGTLCVHAGKGFTQAEAKIGAYMEAIEFSFATPGRNVVDWSLCRPSEILATFKQRVKFYDFCPRMGYRIEHSDEIAVVAGEEIMSHLGRVLVPAELVYFPFFENPGIKLYGTSTNGLASGNTLEEATVHGLAEVMERHVRSFDVIKDRSLLVRLDNAPKKIKSMTMKIENAGLRCHLRYSENQFGLPYFTGYVLEPDEHNPIAIASGFGFHPIAEIAAVRALAEAVQGRLSHIHGGRDDIIKRVETGVALGRDREMDLIRRLRDMAKNPLGNIEFSEIPSIEISSVSQAHRCLYQGLVKAGFNHVVRVTLTELSYPFQVVRIIVPGAEMYEPDFRALVLGSPHTFNNQIRVTMREAICIFAGPSLFDTGLSASTMNDIAWLPPVRRGDIEQLVAKHIVPGVIGLADGTFHSYPSVGHVELREALEMGWRIYGLCSIGAIRASEMSRMAMIPWGKVARMFCSDRNLADDEVALVHSAEPPYAPLSEPMLHLREFCAQAQREGLLNIEQANSILDSLQKRWYGYRTIANFRLALADASVDEKLIVRLLAATNNFRPYRLKQADLVSFVNERPWTVGGKDE